MPVTLETSPRPERQRNPRGEGALLRQEILTATLTMLAAGEAVTLRSIARQAGIAAPSIYRHFADVDAIMSTLAEHAFDELTAALVRDRDATSDPVGRLRAVCESYLRFAREKPHLYRLMFGGVWNATAALETHPDDDERLRALGMNAYGLLVDAIEGCVQVGASSSADPRQDATALWVGLHGFAQLRDTARLFPWPADTENVIIEQLARLQPSD